MADEMSSIAPRLNDLEKQVHTPSRSFRISDERHPVSGFRHAKPLLDNGYTAEN